MTAALRVAVAQLRNVVGDIDGNAERVADTMAWAESEGADVLVLPELVLTGYPLADLVLEREFVDAAERATAALAAQAGTTVTVLSTVCRVPPTRSWDSMERTVSISAALLTGGSNRGTYHKVLLPTHGAYDEGKNLAPGDQPGAVWLLGDVVAGVSICEDLWSDDGPPEAQSRGGARIILAPNASPYHRTKAEGREALATRVARRNGVPLVYANLVGGQDELVFDGGSLVVGADGAMLYRARQFVEERVVLDVPVPRPRATPGPVATIHTRPPEPRDALPPAPVAGIGEELDRIWQALVTGTRDFARKCGFQKAVLGLSGGIDAALTAAVAAEALGADNVTGVAMPAPRTPADELTDARKSAAGLGITCMVFPLEELLTGTDALLSERLGEGDEEEALRRLQRLRGVILTAISDRGGHLILATANKTELSIGAPTLHGDLVGGFAPLRDCPKTLLYELARHRNTRAACVPDDVLEKQSSAQRREGGGLPPYPVLDRIVERSIQHGDGVEDLVATGLDVEVVVDVLRRVDDAEFIRRQSPPGVKISQRAFGTDRTVPICNSWWA